jgi:hypothetical protein
MQNSKWKEQKRRLADKIPNSSSQNSSHKIQAPNPKAKTTIE